MATFLEKERDSDADKASSSYCNPVDGRQGRSSAHEAKEKTKERQRTAPDPH